jgi:DNA-binding CsgD family transcriptional regulator
MNDVLTKHNALMERIVKEYGAIIRGACDKALVNVPCVNDLVAEVHFAVFMTLRKLGEGWTPPRSFVSTIVKNKVNDLVWQHYWDSADAETLKKKRAEQIFQREEVLALVHTLTQAEFKVFRLLGLGLSNEEVAQALFISPLTVRTHVKRIHAKCDIKGRAKLALAAYQVCHHEAADGREVEHALSVESGRFIRPGVLSPQAS